MRPNEGFWKQRLALGFVYSGAVTLVLIIVCLSRVHQCFSFVFWLKAPGRTSHTLAFSRLPNGFLCFSFYSSRGDFSVKPRSSAVKIWQQYLFLLSANSIAAVLGVNNTWCSAPYSQTIQHYEKSITFARHICANCTKTNKTTFLTHTHTLKCKL